MVECGEDFSGDGLVAGECQGGGTASDVSGEAISTNRAVFGETSGFANRVGAA